MYSLEERQWQVRQVGLAQAQHLAQPVSALQAQPCPLQAASREPQASAVQLLVPQVRVLSPQVPQPVASAPLSPPHPWPLYPP